MVAFEKWADSGVGIVEVLGNLQEDDLKAMKEALESVQSKATKPFVVVTLDSCERITLDCLIAIYTLSRALQGQGGMVGLSGVGPGLYRMLLMSDAGQHVKVFKTLEDALRTLGNLR
jgi:anti-anti-sigma regulatory factor